MKKPATSSVLDISARASSLAERRRPRQVTGLVANVGLTLRFKNAAVSQHAPSNTREFVGERAFMVHALSCVMSLRPRAHVSFMAVRSQLILSIAEIGPFLFTLGLRPYMGF